MSLFKETYKDYVAILPSSFNSVTPTALFNHLYKALLDKKCTWPFKAHVGPVGEEIDIWLNDHCVAIIRRSGLLNVVLTFPPTSSERGLTYPTVSLYRDQMDGVPNGRVLDTRDLLMLFGSNKFKIAGLHLSLMHDKPDYYNFLTENYPGSYSNAVKMGEIADDILLTRIPPTPTQSATNPINPAKETEMNQELKSATTTTTEPTSKGQPFFANAMNTVLQDMLLAIQEIALKAAKEAKVSGILISDDGTKKMGTVDIAAFNLVVCMQVVDGVWETKVLTTIHKAGNRKIGVYYFDKNNNPVVEVVETITQ